jgi:hypothetical protein
MTGQTHLGYHYRRILSPIGAGSHSIAQVRTDVLKPFVYNALSKFTLLQPYTWLRTELHTQQPSKQPPYTALFDHLIRRLRRQMMDLSDLVDLDARYVGHRDVQEIARVFELA